MKSLIIVIFITAWLPWTTGAEDALSQGRIMQLQAPCGFRGIYMAPYKVGICTTTMAEDRPMVLLHESQHYLAFQYEMGDVNWAKFERLGLACAKGHSRKVWILANKFASLNPLELHAQLPWLVHGKLCPELQSYYPWFDLRDYELEIENIYPRRERRALGRHH